MTSPIQPTNWLFLRGLAREQRHWGDFPALFESLHDGARVHGLDLPGTGTEHHRASPLSIDGITRDLRRRWHHLKAQHEGPWGLLGISLGGMVTLHWTATFADDFQAAVVINSSTRDIGGPFERLKTRAIPELLRAMREPDPIRREHVILRFTSTRTEGLDQIAQTYAALVDDAPLRRSTAISQITAATRFQTPESIATPLLFLGSWGDNMVDPICTIRLARHFRAPLKVHPVGGHELALDAPEWVARNVRQWLDDRLPTTSIPPSQPHANAS